MYISYIYILYICIYKRIYIKRKDIYQENIYIYLYTNNQSLVLDTKHVLYWPVLEQIQFCSFDRRCKTCLDTKQVLYQGRFCSLTYVCPLVDANISKQHLLRVNHGILYLQMKCSVKKCNFNRGCERIPVFRHHRFPQTTTEWLPLHVNINYSVWCWFKCIMIIQNIITK